MYRRPFRLPLGNGIILEGNDPNEVLETAKKLGYDDTGLYFSESKQAFIEISEMDRNHLFNAIGKLFNRKTGENWNYSYTINILTDPSLNSLVQEYIKRQTEPPF